MATRKSSKGNRAAVKSTDGAAVESPAAWALRDDIVASINAIGEANALPEALDKQARATLTRIVTTAPPMLTDLAMGCAELFAPLLGPHISPGEMRARLDYATRCAVAAEAAKSLLERLEDAKLRALGEVRDSALDIYAYAGRAARKSSGADLRSVHASMADVMKKRRQRGETSKRAAVAEMLGVPKAKRTSRAAAKVETARRKVQTAKVDLARAEASIHPQGSAPAAAAVNGASNGAVVGHA